MHKDLLRLRREDAVIYRAACEGRTAIDGAVLAEECFLVRFFGEQDGDDRLLIVNLGTEIDIAASAEPLLAPPEGAAWKLQWSSEDPQYGGSGTPLPAQVGTWKMPAHAAVLMHPRPRKTV
jgi:maltooligosyltrehalose trehalohydrolase